ncbi:TolB family protein [Streptomyces sp. SHP 1-2]|uniref:TolB family protein n=1 Tax=Streptomyces sp. SHP 1-2 TaxID=2769489 RepID=UPI0022370DD9|nr:hypothetical protein [Streptomyces sp. SHP 1-2]MCW5249709.1 hypothetical protein [Streptomyces sp. SHP 1-2]
MARTRKAIKDTGSDGPPGGRSGRRWLVRGGCALATAALAASALPAHAEPLPTGTIRVSAGPGGVPADAMSWAVDVSGDGRYAVFVSDADNLVPGDTNGQSDVFVRDLWTRRTERVSVGDGGEQADGASYESAISGNGRYVAFTSDDTSLVPGGPSGGTAVYVRDLQRGRTERLATGATSEESFRGSNPSLPSLSWNGRKVAFAAQGGVFVTDRRTGTTRLASVGTDGAPANRLVTLPVISGDGNLVVFISTGTNLPHGRESGAEEGEGILKPAYRRLYLHDMRTGQTRGASIDADGELIGIAPGSGSISADGRYVVFADRVAGTGLSSVPGPRNDVFVHDLKLGTTTRVSGGIGGAPADGSAGGARITANSRWVYFESTSANLVPGDTNEAEDIFRHDLRTGRTERVSRASDGSQSAGESWGVAVDALGTTAVFLAVEPAAPADYPYYGVFARHLPPL